MSMQSSGVTAVTTASDTAVTLISGSNFEGGTRLIVINEGTVAGFVSIDSGTTWARLPAAAAATSPICLVIPMPKQNSTGTILLKRVASGSNLAAVYAFLA